MNRKMLIECFQDTQELSLGRYAEQTMAMQRATRLYNPGFTAPEHPRRSDGRVIEVVADTTYHCAQRCGEGRIAVLNFANAYRPGGGAATGAMAQEECLCRSSNLYQGLTRHDLLESYYHFNQRNTDFAGSDAVIYSPGVMVFKSDDTLPEPLETPFTVDVLTCAAPEFYRAQAAPSDEWMGRLYDQRHRNILEVAIANDVDTLILGAFGCGAFGNPPELVAASFRRLLVDEGYRNCFGRVLFAIKPNDAGNTNYRVFSRILAC